MIERLQAHYGFTRRPFGGTWPPACCTGTPATARPSPGSPGASANAASACSPAKSASARPSPSAPGFKVHKLVCPWFSYEQTLEALTRDQQQYGLHAWLRRAAKPSRKRLDSLIGLRAGRPRRIPAGHLI